jgi:hypothetical protein
MQKYLKFDRSTFQQRITDGFRSQSLAIALIIFGIVVRLTQYLTNRSLWADEATLALNIVNRSFLELLQPLDYDQGAPIGFLLLERSAVQLLGDNEFALRLFPLLSGIAAIFLFYELAKRWLQPPETLIALALFVTVTPLVYFSSEVKQYSSDVAITLLLCLIIPQPSEPKLSRNQVLVRSGIGAIAVWFSHPAVFVLAGLEASNLFITWLKMKQIKLAENLLTYAVWLASFAVVYFVSLRNLGADEELLQSWQKAFPRHLFDVVWGLDALGKFFSNPLGLPRWIDGVAIVAFLMGCHALYYKSRSILFFSVSPILVTLAASYLQKYPFRSRLVIFLIPFFLLLIAAGIAFICRQKSKAVQVLGFILCVVLLYFPITKAGALIAQPRLREEIKPVLSYVQSQQQPGDTLYVYQRGKYQFLYYAKKYGFEEGSYILGVDDLDAENGVKFSEAERQRYQADLDKLRGRSRVWLLFAHAHIAAENRFFESYLDAIGKRKDTFIRPGAQVYLYDLK